MGKRVGQRADFIIAPGFDGVVEIALGDQTGRFFQLLEALKQQILRRKDSGNNLFEPADDLFYFEDDELLKILQKINVAPDIDISE